MKESEEAENENNEDEKDNAGIGIFFHADGYG
jgi:hypothetical protein